MEVVRIFLPKAEIKGILDGLGCSVEQSNTTEFTILPAVTFRIGNNDIDINLENDIRQQDIEVIIDIWAETSVAASNLLDSLESAMRSGQYIMTFSADIPNPGGVFHISTRFKTTK